MQVIIGVDPHKASHTAVALRGVHHQHLRDLGWLTINRVTAARAAPSRTHQGGGSRNPHTSKPKRLRFPTAPTRRCSCTRVTVRSVSANSTMAASSPSNHSPASAPTARARRAANSVGTTTTNSPTATEVGPSPCGCTQPTTTRAGSSTGPRTCGPSRPTTPTSRASTRVATTPKASTATSTTPSGSDAPIASATNAKR